jgi:hypothetical protein
MARTPLSSECCNPHEVGGDLFSLDRPLPLGERFNSLARFRGGNWTVTRWLTHFVPPRLAEYALQKWRTQPDAVLASGTPFLLCLTREALREGLRILIAEWMEFRRAVPGIALDLVIRACRSDPRQSIFDFVSQYWDQAQALKRQLGVPRSGVYLWLREDDDDHALLRAARALIVVARGQSFADEDVPRDYPFAFNSRPAVLRFLGEPRRRATSSVPWPIPEALELAKAIGRLAAADERTLLEAAGLYYRRRQAESASLLDTDPETPAPGRQLAAATFRSTSDSPS